MDTVTIDFETFYDKGYSLTGLTYPEYIFDERFLVQGVGIAYNDEDPLYYPQEEVNAAIDEIDFENVHLVGQNLKFDASILAWVFEKYAASYTDTMDLSSVYWPGQDVSLDLVCKRLWPDDLSMHKGKELASFKGLRHLDDEQQQIMGKYCNQDVNLTRAIFKELCGLVPETEHHLAEMTLRMYIQPQFHLDVERVTAFLEKEKKETLSLVQASRLPKTVLSSNKQFAEWLRGQGIEIPHKVSPSTGKMTDALGQKDPAFLRLMADYPNLEHVWKARANVKSTLNQTRATRLLDLDRVLGKIPVPLKFWGAHTGRWSGTQKINLQNLPRGGELRKSLIAPPGFKVHVADSSNIEARMLAWLAGQMDLLQKFRDKADAYSDMATKLYGYKVDRKFVDQHGNKPFQEEGNVGKTCILGLGYGMGSDKFRYTLAAGPMGSPPILVSQHFSQKAVDTYRNDNPMIVQYWATLGRAAYDMLLPGTNYWIGPINVLHEQIVLPNGAALKYPNLRVEDEKDSEGFSTGRTQLVCDRRNGTTQKIYGGILAENVTQALARIVVSDQILDAAQHFTDSHVVLAVHDEIVLLMPDSNSDQRQSELEEIMRQPPSWAKGLPLDSEGGYANEYSK